MKAHVARYCRQAAAAVLLLALLLGTAADAAVAAPRLPRTASEGAVSPAQKDPDSPANLSGRIVGSAEIALLWSEPIGSPNPAWHYTTQVNESIEIAIELGKTVVSPAGTFYTISPYVYWAKNGALVVDYLVNPSKDDRGGATWWQREYDTLPDPAFILP